MRDGNSGDKSGPRGEREREREREIVSFDHCLIVVNLSLKMDYFIFLNKNSQSLTRNI